MKKIYIVTCGEYSDYYIDSVWDTLEKANEYIKLKKAREKYFDVNPIEEHDVNTHKPFVGVQVYIDLENGYQINALSYVVPALSEFDPRISIYQRRESVLGFGKTEAQALKSARDYRMKILAERAGL